MKRLRLSDVRVELFIREELPPVPPELQGARRETNERARFFNMWKTWAEHYGTTFYPAGADYRIASRLLSQHGYDDLTLRAKEFWLRESQPLIDGSYPHHMILFANKVKGL